MTWGLHSLKDPTGSQGGGSHLFSRTRAGCWAVGASPYPQGEDSTWPGVCVHPKPGPFLTTAWDSLPRWPLA